MILYGEKDNDTIREENDNDTIRDEYQRNRIDMQTHHHNGMGVK